MDFPRNRRFPVVADRTAPFTRSAVAALVLLALPAAAQSPAPDGPALFQQHCAECHGRNGRGEPASGRAVPPLNDPDVLAVASDDYYRWIITRGRSGTLMPAWSEKLSRPEIDAIVAHIRSWEPAGAPVESISARAGRPAVGETLFEHHCAPCHGNAGAGGLGVSLRSAPFLGSADDRFLAESIIHGRPGTAMPAWRQLAPQAVSDILAYMRSWQSDFPRFDAVAAVLENAPREELVDRGRRSYGAQCAACHGEEGEGSIGPSLTSPTFLGVVDAAYLYLAIVQGRPGTAMPTWRHLDAEEIAGLIAFLQSHPAEPLPAFAELATGDAASGATVYAQTCAACHGERAIGGSGPQLANPVFLGIISDQTLTQWIAFGRAGTEMDGFGRQVKGDAGLSLQQIADVVAYVRSVAASPDVPAHAPVLRPVVGDAAIGAKLYGDHCAACHGEHGEGGKGPQLHNPTFLRTVPDGYLAATLVMGRPGSQMRARVHGGDTTRELAPAEVPHLIAHLRSWREDTAWREPRPMAVTNPRGVLAGRQLFARNCSSCHGPRGLGSGDGGEYVVPAINNPEFLHAVTDGMLVATIVRGRELGGMPPFGPGAGGAVELDAGAIHKIVSYMRSWQLDSAAAP